MLYALSLNNYNIDVQLEAFKKKTSTKVNVTITISERYELYRVSIVLKILEYFKNGNPKR